MPRFRVTLTLLNTKEIGFDEDVTVSAEGNGLWPTLEWFANFTERGRKQLADDLARLESELDAAEDATEPKA